MGKRSRERREGEGNVGSGDSDGGSGVSWLPIVMAAVALVLGFVAWTDTRAIKTDLSKKLAAVDAQVVALQTKLASAPKAQPAPQGPDPNKVYPVKVDGSPSKGNATAPIVIAEFSDYQ